MENLCRRIMLRGLCSQENNVWKDGHDTQRDFCRVGFLQRNMRRRKGSIRPVQNDTFSHYTSSLLNGRLWNTFNLINSWCAATSRALWLRQIGVMLDQRHDYIHDALVFVQHGDLKCSNRAFSCMMGRDHMRGTVRAATRSRAVSVP